jgi:hypothetical protein
MTTMILFIAVEGLESLELYLHKRPPSAEPILQLLLRG